MVFTSYSYFQLEESGHFGQRSTAAKFKSCIFVTNQEQPLPLAKPILPAIALSLYLQQQVRASPTPSPESSLLGGKVQR
jgi:hypothetical protein